MNINVAAKCIRISSFLSAQPDDSRHDRVAPGRVHWNYFASPAPIFENRSSRSAVANFVRDLQFTQRRTVTSGAIAQSEFGSRNRIGGDEVAFLEQRLSCDVANLFAVFKGDDSGKRNEMPEIDDFVGLIERAAKTMKDAADLPAIVSQNLERIIPGVALMNHNVEAQRRGEIEQLLK